MAEFLVRICDPCDTTRVIQRRVEATDRHAVAAALGVAPAALLAVEAVAPAASAAPRADMSVAWNPLRRSPLSLRHFGQELAVLLDAGIPLLEALQTLREKENKPGAAASLDALAAHLSAGQPLSQAMAEQPMAFDELIRAIVAASERSGLLSQALRQHAQYLAWSDSLRSRLLAACIYPVMILVIGGAVTAFLLLFVLPRFAGVLDSLGGDLNLGSRLLIGYGRWARRASVGGAGSHADAGDGPGSICTAPAHTRCGYRRSLALGLARATPAGDLAGAAVSQSGHAAGCRRAGGASAAHHAGAAAVPLQPGVAEALLAITHGARLSDALDQHGLSTAVSQRMVRVGERTGELPQMLERAAAFHDEELAQLADFIARAINPLLMLLIGVVIGGIILLMYLPIFQLVEQVQ